MNKLPATIAATLKAARESKRWTQADVASRAHISTSQLARFEDSGGDLPAARLVDLANALEFEMMVIPQELVRTVARLDLSRDTGGTNAATQLRSLWKSANRLSSRWPQNAVLKDLVDSSAELLDAPLSDTLGLRLQALTESAQEDLDSIRQLSDGKDPERDLRLADIWRDLKRVATGVRAVSTSFTKQKTAHKRAPRRSH